MDTDGRSGVCVRTLHRCTPGESELLGMRVGRTSTSRERMFGCWLLEYRLKDDTLAFFMR